MGQRGGGAGRQASSAPARRLLPRLPTASQPIERHGHSLCPDPVPPPSLGQRSSGARLPCLILPQIGDLFLRSPMASNYMGLRMEAQLARG